MSFTGDVKKELVEIQVNARHCRIAELAAIISLAGYLTEEEGCLTVRSENLLVLQRYVYLVKKLFDLSLEINQFKREATYYSDIDIKQTKRILQTVKVRPVDLNTDSGHRFILMVDNIVMQQMCCKRAFIRGQFLTAGSITNPEKMYHFEITTESGMQVEQLCSIMESFDIDARVIERKKREVVYVKESEQISDLLNIIEAHVSLMKLENIRILKGVRNTVNRRVNCEAANISKTVTAASKQISDIIYIRDSIGLEKLSEGLSETAELRIENPEASLQELGELHIPPIGKSGVNHRLKKLIQMAEKLRM